MSTRGGFWLALIGVALLAGPASATVIAGDTWYEFSFTDAGVPALGCDPADPAGSFCVPSSGTPTSLAPPPPWEIVLAEPGSFTLTDAFLAGDRFDVFDFGNLIGGTSAPTLGANCGDDPADCLADPEISSGVFLLAAGNHALTIVPSESLLGGGVGYFRVGTEVAVIPEPGSLAWLGMGALFLGVLRRFTA
jgi:hypothetical protein